MKTGIAGVLDPAQAALLHLLRGFGSGTINASFRVRRANNPCKQCLREPRQMRRTMTHFFQHRHGERPSANTEAASTSWNVLDDPELQPGARLVTPRHGYRHHGIYAGEGKVMHYAGLCRSLHSGPVEEVSIARFAAGHEIWIKPSPFPMYAGQEAVRRARSRLGENRYRLLTNNCEHFCTWCVYGESYSEQVEECLAFPRAALPVTVRFLRAFFDAGSKAMHSWLDNTALLPRWA
jgi:hypothetical protein